MAARLRGRAEAKRQGFIVETVVDGKGLSDLRTCTVSPWPLNYNHLNDVPHKHT